MHWFLKFIFGIKLCVSDSSSVHHQEFFTVHTAMVYVIQVCWQLYSRYKFEELVHLVGFITRIRQVGFEQNVRLRDVIQSAKNPRLLGQIDKRWRLIGLQSRDWGRGNIIVSNSVHSWKRTVTQAAGGYKSKAKQRNLSTRYLRGTLPQCFVVKVIILQSLSHFFSLCRNYTKL